MRPDGQSGFLDAVRLAACEFFECQFAKRAFIGALAGRSSSSLGNNPKNRYRDALRRWNINKKTGTETSQFKEG